MLKNRKLFMTVFGSLILCIFLSATTVFADDEADTSGNISDLIDIENPVGKWLIDLFGDMFDIEYEAHEYMDDPKSGDDINKAE